MWAEGTGELQDVNEDISPWAKLETSTAFSNRHKTMQLTINHSDSGSCCLGNYRECQFTCNIYVCVCARACFGWLIGMWDTMKEEGCSVLVESMKYSFAAPLVESVWWLCPHLDHWSSWQCNKLREFCAFTDGWVWFSVFKLFYQR